MEGPHDPMDLINIRQGASGELTLKKKKRTHSTKSPSESRHRVAMVTMMMPLSPRRNWVLRPERAIQEVAARERRASHTGNRCNTRAKWRRVCARSSHAERKHTIEHFFFTSSIRLRGENKMKYARVATNALAVVWHTRCESASGGLTPSSVRR